MNAFSSSKRGATLVEVLIVIGIVAILALAASANYQRIIASVKVAKVQSDFRTLDGAMEMSAIDRGRYMVSMPGISDLELRSLTTPISYLSTLPDDPFGSVAWPDVNYPDGGYDYVRYYQLHQPFDILLIEPWFQYSGIAEYRFISTGPNGAQDVQYRAPGILNYRFEFTEYDPTNGVISAGDITSG